MACRLGAAFLLLAATACSSSSSEPLGTVEAFCSEWVDVTREVLVTGADFDDAMLVRLAVAAPTEDIRDSLDEARERLAAYEDSKVTSASDLVDRDPDDWGPDLGLQAAFVSSMTEAHAYAVDNCLDRLEDDPFGVEFTTPREPGESSDAAAIREIDDITIESTRLGGGSFRVTYVNGVTCVQPVDDPEADGICHDARGFPSVRSYFRAGNETAGFAPATTGSQIVFQDQDGVETLGEMLTPHLWRASFPVGGEPPYTVRVGDFLCLAFETSALADSARCTTDRPDE